LKLEQVEGAGNFLLDIMPVLFVPAAVGLMESYGQLKEVLVPVFIICLLSTVVVMAVTGKVAEGMMKLHEKNELYGTVFVFWSCDQPADLLVWNVAEEKAGVGSAQSYSHVCGYGDCFFEGIKGGLWGVQ
jgi:hypothetical protein